jgi:hypothetical protein
MTQGRLVEQYQEYLDLYLQYREAVLALNTRRELLAALCSGRGALHFSGMGDPLGEQEQGVAFMLSEQELRLVLQGIEIDKCTSRLRGFLHLSEQHGGDVSLIEPEEERQAVVEEGKLLLWERHDIECQLAGIRWWLNQREELRVAIEPVLTECYYRLSQLDALWKDNIQHFLPLNAYRRAYRQAYPQAQELWWWHLTADCDIATVYRVAEGHIEPSSHLHDCPSCQSLLGQLKETASLLGGAQSIAVSHPQPEELVRLYYGEIAGQEEQALEWHVQLCETCRWEFEAIQRGEEDEDGEIEDVDDVAAAMAQVVVYTFPLPSDEALRVAAGRTTGVRGLPGELIYKDGEFEVWVDEQHGRIVLRVYDRELQGLGALTVREHDSLATQAITATVRGSTVAEFDLGAVAELRGKRLRLSFQHDERDIELPRLDLIGEVNS